MSQEYHAMQLPLFSDEDYIEISQLSLFDVPPDPVLKKLCRKCTKRKTFDEFYPNEGGKYGLHGQCKQCKSEQGKRAYHENHEEALANKRKTWRSPEKVAYRKRRYQDRCERNPEAVTKNWQQLREWQIAHPLRVRAIGMRHNARKRETATERINYEAILERDGCVCHICNQPIDLSINKGQGKLQFDHVIPLLPRRGEPQGTHEAFNIRPAHDVCNRRKGNKPLSFLSEWQRRGPNS